MPILKEVIKIDISSIDIEKLVGITNKGGIATFRNSDEVKLSRRRKYKCKCHLSLSG